MYGEERDQIKSPLKRKYRRKTAHISGKSFFGSTSGGGTLPVIRNLDVTRSLERTSSHSTTFPIWRRYLREHPEIFELSPGLKWYVTHSDFGASFFHELVEYSSSLNNLSFSGSFRTLQQSYSSSQKGPVMFGDPFSGNGLTTDAEEALVALTLISLGTTAINRCRPNKPGVDVLVSIAELKRDGLPHMIGSLAARTKTVRDAFRNGGKEYLNEAFGWSPLLNDLRRLCETVINSKKLLEQHERDVSRLIRRRYYFDPETETQNIDGGAVASQSKYWPLSSTPVADNWSVNARNWGSNADRVSIDHVTENQTWFSGGFRFYERTVPQALESLAKYEEQANLLLGTRLDPEVLWNLVPWSWLVDWFFNFGDIIGNISAIVADQLVVQHGYIMQTQTITTEVTTRNLVFRGGNLGTSWLGGYRPLSNSRSIVRNWRFRALPYGFGLTYSDLTPNQWAILGALGMTRRS